MVTVKLPPSRTIVYVNTNSRLSELQTVVVVGPLRVPVTGIFRVVSLHRYLVPGTTSNLHFSKPALFGIHVGAARMVKSQSQATSENPESIK
jgi:hypothetical protein